MRGTRGPGASPKQHGGIIPAHAGNTISYLRRFESHWDHPRACGEHERELAVVRFDAGSSPRMRGTPNLWKTSAGTSGIIPAHAGNTSTAASWISWTWDHPRACGEHLYSSTDVLRKSGSSPRMRGTLRLLERCLVDRGIIPAHAGNTPRRSHVAETCWDHPRACGEHFMIGIALAVVRGSSPRMRGTPIPHFPAADVVGIIPAHAGNTHGCTRQAHPARDHPRACGEHVGNVPLPRQQRGSSPRMRGTHWILQCCRMKRGIIPAHAGNTVCDRFCNDSSRDHPRACGEHKATTKAAAFGSGSSPRMRGTPTLECSCLNGTGIIPAHAGNTARRKTPDGQARDHPRACGEHCRYRAFGSRRLGSSPRMRGTLMKAREDGDPYRIIPAHAGNTASSGR